MKKKTQGPIEPPSPSYSFYSTKTLTAKKLSQLNSQEIAEAILVIPPDNWYGWVVTFAAFTISFLTDGSMYTFGIFLEDISHSLEVSVTQVAIANSLMTGLNFGLGPIVCALINRYGFRSITIIGGVLMAASFVGATFSNDLYLFLAVMGIIGGSASCMIYTPAIIVVGFYFEKWRALATAITACGSSLGIMTFPPVFTQLLSHFSWQTKFRILAGCNLFCCLLALTFKPIRPIKIEDEHLPLSSYSVNTPYAETGRTGRGNRKYPTISQANFGGEGHFKREPDDMSLYSEMVRHYSTTTINRNSTYTEAMSTRYTVFDGESTFNDQDTLTCCQKCYLRCCNRKIRDDGSQIINRPMYRDDIFYPASVYTLPQYTDREVFSSAADRKAISFGYHMSVTRLTTLKDLEEQNTCVCCPVALRRTMATMLDFSMLKVPSFILVSCSGTFTLLALFPPFMFIGDKAEEMGIEHAKAVLLLSIIGVANVVGRMLCGVLSFCPAINVTVFISVTQILCGGSLITSNYLDTFIGQASCAAWFGFTIAAFICLRTIMLVDLYGLENLTNCFGLTLLFQGLASFVGVPIASVLKNQTGTFKPSFLLLGSCIALSGILLIPVPILAKHEKKKKKIPTTR